MKTGLPIQTNQVALKRDYSVWEKANFLHKDGGKLAKIYNRAAKENNDPRSLAIADLLEFTNHPENIFIARDMVNTETGELFDGYGVLTNLVCSRASKPYLQAQARRHRKYVRMVLDNYEPSRFLRYQFVTFTLPFLKTDFETVLKINAKAMELFKKRQLWKLDVDGAFISEEVTIGSETTVNQTHYHLHYHALVLGKKLDKRIMADNWTDCVEKACKQFDVDCLFYSQGNRLQLDISDVQNYAKDHQKTLEDCVQELCKYIVKGSEFEKVPANEVSTIDRALVGRRMYKTYGSFNKKEIKKLDWFESNKNQKLERSDIFLDKQCTTDGKQQLPFKRTKKPTMVDVGERLIKEGKRDIWRSMIGVTLSNRVEVRAAMLMWQNPNTTFTNLNGDRWFGVAKRPKNNVVQFKRSSQKREIKRTSLAEMLLVVEQLQE